MHFDLTRDRSMLAQLRARPHRTASRRPWLRLVSEVLQLAGGQAEFLRHGERPWASATFSGSRHTIALAFDGSDAVAQGEAFIATLPDHEFRIPGQLVADATIASVDHVSGAPPRLVVEADLLLLEDG